MSKANHIYCLNINMYVPVELRISVWLDVKVRLKNGDETTTSHLYSPKAPDCTSGMKSRALALSRPSATASSAPPGPNHITVRFPCRVAGVDTSQD